MSSSKHTFKFNLPTILTLSRIITIPVFIYISPDHPLLGAVVFFLISITDFLDGYLARKWKQVTTFGIIMDPIADKFLVISALILLVYMGLLSVWIATVIVVREFLVTALRGVALSRDIVISAETGGKMKTVSQMVAIIALFLSQSALNVSISGIDLFDLGTVAIWIAMILAVISGIQYTVAFSKKMVNSE